MGTRTIIEINNDMLDEIRDPGFGERLFQLIQSGDWKHSDSLYTYPDQGRSVRVLTERFSYTDFYYGFSKTNLKKI
jgi:hypothetical protein